MWLRQSEKSVSGNDGPIFCTHFPWETFDHNEICFIVSFDPQNIGLDALFVEYLPRYSKKEN